MELTTKLFIILLFSTLFILMVYSLLKRSKEEKEEERKMKERLADETIYDPISGLKLTLEEAESGLFIDPDNPGRIKSEEELQNYFTEENIEFERIKAFIIKNNLLTLEEDKEERLIENIISKADIFQSYEGFSVGYTVQLFDNVFISLALVDYSLQLGKYRHQGSEWQILGTVVNERMTVKASDKKYSQEDLKNILGSISKDFTVGQIDENYLFKINTSA